MIRTLIVEDNATFRQSFKDLLCTRFPSMVVQEAVDGKEALREIDATIPDIIFMDIKLPEGNGLELTQKIKTSCPKIPIIILTSCDLPEYRQAANQYGADYFLPKTTSTGKVVELVQAILSEKSRESHDPNRI